MYAYYQKSLHTLNHQLKMEQNKNAENTRLIQKAHLNLVVQAKYIKKLEKQIAQGNITKKAAKENKIVKKHFLPTKTVKPGRERLVLVPS